jgi:hypothetical protein
MNPYNSSYSFIDSVILTQNERISLTQMLNSLTEVKLIYRASRDVFETSSCENVIIF